jgi:hypothetical protein
MYMFYRYVHYVVKVLLMSKMLLVLLFYDYEGLGRDNQFLIFETIIPGFLSDFDNDKNISALKAFLLVNC